MRFDFPLLPVRVELRWRPLRKPRFSIGRMMLVVVGAALFFSLIAHQAKLRDELNESYQRSQVAARAKSLHRAKVRQNLPAMGRNDVLLALIIHPAIGASLLFVAGRAMSWAFRRSIAASEDAVQPE